MNQEQTGKAEVFQLMDADPSQLFDYETVSAGGMEFIIREINVPDYGEWQKRVTANLEAPDDEKQSPIESAAELLALSLCFTNGELCGLEFVRAMPARLVDLWSQKVLDVTGVPIVTDGENPAKKN